MLKNDISSESSFLTLKSSINLIFPLARIEQNFSSSSILLQNSNRLLFFICSIFGREVLVQHYYLFPYLINVINLTRG